MAHWGQRFEANRYRIAATYDEKFVRMWEFYLTSAEMMFRTGSQLVFHMQLAPNATPCRSIAPRLPTSSGHTRNWKPMARPT